jgi:hypothetical protein
LSSGSDSRDFLYKSAFFCNLSSFMLKIF